MINKLKIDNYQFRVSALWRTEFLFLSKHSHHILHIYSIFMSDLESDAFNLRKVILLKFVLILILSGFILTFIFL